MRSTPHINPTAPIAETILLPGDPLRAKFIAENYLEDVQQFNAVRNMLGFTGTYQGTPVSVMGTSRARGHLWRAPARHAPVRCRRCSGSML